MAGYKNKISFWAYGGMELVTGECVHTFPLHIHESTCVGIITGGRALFSLRGRTWLLTAGDTYWVLPYTPHTLAAAGAETFTYAAVCCPNRETQHAFTATVCEAKQLLEEAAGKVSMDALAQAVHTSKFHLERLFKAQVGIPPYQYRIGHTIKKARQELQMPFSLPDLAYTLGFTDQSHLCNTFKKHVGITPLQYASAYTRL